MMDHETNSVHCAGDDCVESFENHRWGRIKAHDAGWFEQKDGIAWCPEHKPDWVDAWRAREAAKKGKAT